MSGLFLNCEACKRVIVLAAGLHEACVLLTVYSIPGMGPMCS